MLSAALRLNLLQTVSEWISSTQHKTEILTENGKESEFPIENQTLQSVLNSACQQVFPIYSESNVLPTSPSILLNNSYKISREHCVYSQQVKHQSVSTQ